MDRRSLCTVAGAVGAFALLIRVAACQGGSEAHDTAVAHDAANETAGDGALGEVGAAAETGGTTTFLSLIPGPGQPGFDADLEAKATRYERQFQVFNASPMACNADVSVPLANPENRDLIEKFLKETDEWDFEGWSDKEPADVVGGWAKVAGLYGGAGIAANAFRYGVLRDQGYPVEERERARAFLLASLEALHLATAITGVKGVIARGFIRTDIPGDGKTTQTTPLFDEATGQPLPVEKNNGTWREDNSGGLFPGHIWEDSCSRDMYIGWVAAFAGTWEVIRNDHAFSDELKARLKADATAIVHELKVVRPSGYDLEIPDADGRTTFHGYMNENNLDRIYVPGIRNGFYSIMALGCVAGLNYVAEDPEIEAWLYDDLIAKRKLHIISSEPQTMVNQGPQSNFSNQNMAFMGAWLAMRYVEKEGEGRVMLKKALAGALYDSGEPNQPAEMKQSFFDFTFVAGVGGATASSPMTAPPDEDALANGLETLSEFPEPPYWELGIENCDAQEIEAGSCLCADGETTIELVGNVGWGDKLVASRPIPMRIRHPSNYHWRSNPYEPNGDGDGTRLLPAVDFRWAYWMGRWVRR
jgi:hypothetical protein